MATTEHNDEFQAHGVFCISNALSYEIEISESGDGLRARRTLHDGTQEVSQWAEIEHGAFDKSIALDVFGFDIDVSQVMRIHTPKET